MTGIARRLPPREADRLAKLCGMLGSTFDGERANAAAAATALLRKHELTWRELIEGACRDEPRSLGGWRGDLADVLDGLDHLTEWEVGFAYSLDQGDLDELSDKQSAVLAKLVAKVRRGR